MGNFLPKSKISLFILLFWNKSKNGASSVQCGFWHYIEYKKPDKQEERFTSCLGPMVFMYGKLEEISTKYSTKNGFSPFML